MKQALCLLIDPLHNPLGTDDDEDCAASAVDGDEGLALGKAAVLAPEVLLVT